MQRESVGFTAGVQTVGSRQRNSSLKCKDSWVST